MTNIGTDWDSLHQNTGMLRYEPAVIGLKQNGGYQSGWNLQPTKKDDQRKHKKETPFLVRGPPIQPTVDDNHK